MAGFTLAIALGSLQAADAAKTRELLAVLQSKAELAERARACQQLAIFGTAEAIPALASLLGDEKIGHYARDVLEVMPDAAAGDALRAALDRLQGDTLVGVINSVGVRRDTQAVASLTRLARSGAAAVATAALHALGRIAAPDAVTALQSALKEADPARRAVAAEALLVAAERVKSIGSATPLAIYDAVRTAAVPITWRAAATRGAILARHKDALPLLLEQLRSAEEPLRDIGLRILRELPTEDFNVATLTAGLGELPVTMQALVLAALADRHDAERYAGVIEAHITSPESSLRLVALQALGRMGTKASVPLLLRTALTGTGPETDAAWTSLARIGTSAADDALVAALRTAPPAQQVRIIGVLGERSATSATPALLQLAAGSDSAVREAALRMLGLVAKPPDLPQVLPLALAARNENELTLADRAIVTISMKILEPERRAAPVLAAFQEAADTEQKARLLRPLGAIVRMMGGNHDVFFAVRPALDSPAPKLRAAALDCLAEWPDAAPTTRLLALANDPAATANERTIALRGALRMAANVAAGHEHSPLNVVEAFAQANRAVRTKEEKLMMVSGLGSLKRPEALKLLTPYLADADVRTEAAIALLQIAPALGGIGRTPALKPLLETIAADEPDEEVRRKAGRLAKGGAAEAGKAKGKGKQAAGAAPASVTPTTNDLSSWEGDPGVWRIRDGTIVGGSLAGNPRNEFLATKRSYRDFVVRVEYRLIGTEGFVNGGVQFRSVIAQPPNEMSGYQADIGAGHSGCLYDESRRKKFLARAPDEQIKRLEKPGDWNTYEIRCEGARIELTLNGEKTVSYTETEPGIAPDGLIALQIHGNSKAEIQFRNIVIEPLPTR